MQVAAACIPTCWVWFQPHTWFLVLLGLTWSDLVHSKASFGCFADLDFDRPGEMDFGHCPGLLAEERTSSQVNWIAAWIFARTLAICGNWHLWASSYSFSEEGEWSTHVIRPLASVAVVVDLDSGEVCFLPSSCIWVISVITDKSVCQPMKCVLYYFVGLSNCLLSYIAVKAPFMPKLSSLQGIHQAFCLFIYIWVCKASASNITSLLQCSLWCCHI
jgi:hypothetical protein